MSSEFPSEALVVLIVYGVIGLFVFLQYILGAIGFHTMAKKRGYNKGWFAWFPIFNEYLVGAIADDIAMRKGRKSGLRKAILGLIIAPMILVLIFLGIMIAMAVFAGNAAIAGGELSSDGEAAVALTAAGAIFIYVIAGILVFIQKIVSLVALGKIYCDYSTNGALMVVLTIFFPVVKPFMVFAIRKNTPKSLMPQPQPQYAPAYGAPAGYQPQQGYAQPANGYQQYQPQQGYAQPNNGYQMQNPMPQNIPQQTMPQQNIPEQNIPQQTMPEQNIPEQANTDINNGQ